MMHTTNHPSPKVRYRIPNLPRLPAAPAPSHRRNPDPAQFAAELNRGLQLSRAGALALTRLQLAIQCGDRHAAMAAMDRLHAIDADMERLVERLPAPDDGDPARGEWDAIARHLADQKLSLAFEKLAMVSAISGPDMISAPSPHMATPGFDTSRSAQPNAWPHPSSARPETRADPESGPGEIHGSNDEPPLVEWPRLPEVQPAEWKAIPVWLLGLLATILAMIAVAAAVVAMTVTGS